MICIYRVSNSPNVAYCFQYGIGTSIDLVQAIEWYQKAAEEDDNVEALVQLGLIHSQGGPGVPVDQGHAIDLIQRAAERGHPAGQYQLGKTRNKKGLVLLLMFTHKQCRHGLLAWVAQHDSR